MPLVLPRVHVDRAERFVMESRSRVLSKKEQKYLLSLERTHSRSGVLPGERIVPLEDARWAVGRGLLDATVWRVVSMEDLSELPHPAWLWSEDDWFSVDPVETGPQPKPLPLKRSLRKAARLTDSIRRMHELLPAVIAHLRSSKSPLAIVAPIHNLDRPTSAGRWFALALISSLPSEMSLDLRISCLEVEPDPSQWDIVLTDTAPEGFTVIEASQAPDIGNDLVAWYIRRRLLDGEPELVEAIAPLWDDDADDPWGACLERQLVTEGPSRIGVGAEMLENNLELAHRLVRTRVLGGAELTAKLANELVAVTLRTQDTSLWEQLDERTEAERRVLFKAWLDKGTSPPPDDTMLELAAAIRPEGYLITEWAGSLLDWFRHGHCPGLSVPLLIETLEEDFGEPDIPTRASLWTELIVGLVKADRSLEAIAALTQPTAKRLAQSGTSRALANAWLTIPGRFRTDAALKELVDLFVVSTDGDAAATQAWVGLKAHGDEEGTLVLVEEWARCRAAGAIRATDVFIERLASSPQRRRWVEAIAEQAAPDRLHDLLAPAIPEDHPELWVLAEETWTRVNKPYPKDRFSALWCYLPEATLVLEEQARALLEDVVIAATLPDQNISSVSSIFAQGGARPAVWMWAAIAAATPDQFDDETIDATVHAFFSAPPVEIADRKLVLSLTNRLGLAADWDAMDHARWFVRMCLAPDGDGSHFHMQLAETLCRAIVQRRDSIPRLAEIANALLELPPKHPALRYFISVVMPAIWPESPPNGFLVQVKIGEAPNEVRLKWKAAIGG